MNKDDIKSCVLKIVDAFQRLDAAKEDFNVQYENILEEFNINKKSDFAKYLKKAAKAKANEKQDDLKEEVNNLSDICEVI